MLRIDLVINRLVKYINMSGCIITINVLCIETYFSELHYTYTYCIKLNYMWGSLYIIEFTRISLLHIERLPP